MPLVEWQQELVSHTAILFLTRLFSSRVGASRPAREAIREPSQTIAADGRAASASRARESELFLSDVDAVARAIGHAFGLDPGTLRFVRLQASMLFRGDDGWIYRVPAKRHAREGFFAERDLMDLLANRMPVETPVWQVASGTLPMARYRYIPGEAFQVGRAGDSLRRDRQITDLAAFLAALHATPPPMRHSIPVQGRGTRKWAERLRQRGRSDLAEEFEQVGGRFAVAMAQRPAVLCHGDLKGGNILIDTEKGSLAGVIDFTAWTVAPPETDLARIGLSAMMLGRLADHYEELSGSSLDREALAIASRFFACRRAAKRVLKGGR